MVAGGQAGRVAPDGWKRNSHLRHAAAESECRSSSTVHRGGGGAAGAVAVTCILHFAGDGQEGEVDGRTPML